MNPPACVIAVVGPTASGKSAVAEAIARRLGGEIVSADSMQVYRGMDIGTAKVPVADRRVPYHCVDLVAPGAPYSAALYQSDARAAIDSIRAHGAIPVVAGGTGLYVRAALDEFAFPPGSVESPERARIERLAVELGAEGIHARLREVDPEAATLIHPRNTRRVVRALEMAAEGTSYAGQAARFAERRTHYADTRYLGLSLDREVLYARIDERVDDMLAAGLIGEVEALLRAGYRDALTARQAIGYKELVPVIEGRADLAAAAAAIKQATRRYAKRQLTWFRADPRVRWLDATGLSPEDSVRAALDLVESPERTREEA